MVCWWCIRHSACFFNTNFYGTHTHVSRIFITYREIYIRQNSWFWNVYSRFFFAAMHFLCISFIPFRLFCLTPIEAAERCSTWHSTHFFLSRWRWAADSGTVMVKGFLLYWIDCVTKNSCSLVRFHFPRFFLFVGGAAADRNAFWSLKQGLLD